MATSGASSFRWTARPARAEFHEDTFLSMASNIRRLTRAQAKEETVKRLIESAGRVVALRGFGAASVDEIAEGAGFSRGAFYSNFDSKEALLLRLLQAHVDAEVLELEDLLEAAADAAEFARRLDAWVAGFHRDADWALLSAEMQLHALRDAGFASEYEKFQGAHRRALANVLERIFGAFGKKPPLPSVDLAATVKALAQGLALQNAARRGAGPAIDAAAAIKSLMQSLIEGAAPAAAKGAARKKQSPGR